MKYIFTLAICLFSLSLFAQQKQNQFILIVRSKAKIKASQDEIKTNISHWMAYMGDLGKNGKIAGGYRLPVEGVTLTGPDRMVTDKPYIDDGKMVSSFIIINAADMNEAKQIAAKCPVFELGGNVEIREIQETAH
jgi:hypothetical protein